VKPFGDEGIEIASGRERGQRRSQYKFTNRA
jgi:hypothetical protein